MALGQSAEARTFFQEALTCRQAWSRADPGSVPARSYVMEAYLWLGIASAHGEDARHGLEHFEQALRIGADLVRQYPGDFSFKGDLAEVWGARGDALLRLGKAEEADKSYRDSLKSLGLVVAHNPGDLSRQPLLALAHERLAAASARRGQGFEAARHYQEALRIRGDLLRIEPDNLSWQAAYLLALARGGQYAEAAEGAVKLRPRLAHSTALLLQVARSYAVCAGGDAPRKQQHVARALETLRAATGPDCKDPSLETDPDLETLRPEAAFQEILAAVKARARK